MASTITAGDRKTSWSVRSHSRAGLVSGGLARVARVTAPTAAAAAIFVVAIAYRAYAIATTVPALGADESVIGIMAQQIL